ncbi:uncharacterized protein PGRI_087920 [Penicillium griseofulvum]|uniref:Uncharacterized protein n=1 Tax=Penicillium patulum TaxID=5078 RepID=A0A135LU43_PENPA|nr:uncharacterized protein PGRI_087920 [Penicillium griseofulvum]KXG52508.1 hypothetical protein PGRI_087920 [Penicillium griseofulvum]
MAAPLHLHLASLDDDDPWIVEQKYFAILDNSLQPDSQVSAAEAATGLNELTPMNRKANGEEAEEPVSWCLEFWGTINELVKQIPYDHPSQDKMVEIIQELKALPGVEVPVSNTTRRIWTDLPYLVEVWFEYAVNIRPKDGPLEFERWINWQAFSARALQAGLADWFRLATRCFRHTFEEEHLQGNEFSESLIRGAAQWIEYSGERLFQSLDKLPKFIDLKPGKLYTGKMDLSRERWDFWEASFRACAGNETFTAETVLICDKAAQKMAAIAANTDGSDEQGCDEAATSQ